MDSCRWTTAKCQRSSTTELNQKSSSEKWINHTKNLSKEMELRKSITSSHFIFAGKSSKWFSLIEIFLLHIGSVGFASQYEAYLQLNTESFNVCISIGWAINKVFYTWLWRPPNVKICSYDVFWIEIGPRNQFMVSQWSVVFSLFLIFDVGLNMNTLYSIFHNIHTHTHT